MNATKNPTVELALGRIFGMMSRPSQPGDVAEYERCRAIVLDELGDARVAYQPSFARDYHAIVMSGE
jgi:hypothetical protein